MLQVLLLITAYGIQFFSMKKMGMMRYVLYINKEWQAQYPIFIIQTVAIALLVLLCASIILYVKIKKDNHLKDKKFLPMLIIDIILTLSFVIFTFAFSTESYRSYYFTSLILGVTTLMENIKILVYLKNTK
jgi:heme/copper-type cytochrome/quinol oxidase subunit 3